MTLTDARIIKLSDWHIPYHDTQAMFTAIAFTKYMNPDIIVIDEPIDFYALSKFSKDPKRALRLQEEIDMTLNYFNIIRSIFHDQRVILLNSNHLDRLERYLCGRAPELFYLKSLDIRNLLQLERFGIEFMDIYVHNGLFVFKHGDFVRKHSASSAKAEFEKEGMSGASSHVHRLGEYNVTKRGGKFKWIECGCLCRLDPDYINGIPDWQQGLGKVDFVGEHFLANTYNIINGQIIVDRTLIRGKEILDRDLRDGEVQ
jgi:hypothetical protein